VKTLNRFKRLAKYYSKSRPQRKRRPSQRPPYLQMKHEQRVIAITLKRYNTSAGYWPIEALIKLADLGVYSAVEYYTNLIKECITGRHGVSPSKIYESKPLDDKYYHGIPNNTSFQKLLASLEANTPLMAALEASTPKVNNA